MDTLFVVPTVATQWAALALLSFDTLLTLDQEISLVWMQPLSIHRALYFLIRYLGLAWAIAKCSVSLASRSPRFCAIMNIGNTTWLFVAAAAEDALLMLRVIGLLKGNRLWRLTVKGLYTGIYSVLFALLCYDLARQPIPSWNATGDHNLGCTDITTAQSALSFAEVALSIATSLILLFNVLLLMIVLLYALPQYRSSADHNTPLLTLLVRDGSIYFVTTCLCLVFIAVTPVALWHQPTMSMMSLSPFSTISVIAACRTFLNLRSRAARSSRETMVGAPSSMNFNMPGGESNVGAGLWPSLDEEEEEVALRDLRSASNNHSQGSHNQGQEGLEDSPTSA